MKNYSILQVKHRLPKTWQTTKKLKQMQILQKLTKSKYLS